MLAKSEIVRQCKHCGKEMLLRTQRDIDRKRFCSRPCLAFWQYANGAFGIRPKGSANPNWKGGKYTQVAGYVMILCSDGKYRGEHRLNLEASLNRPLSSNEQVHHKNGVRHDNRLENLELWIGNQPTGVRAYDLETPIDAYLKEASNSY